MLTDLDCLSSLPAVKAAVGMADATEAAVFAELRARKDRF